MLNIQIIKIEKLKAAFAIAMFVGLGSVLLIKTGLHRFKVADNSGCVTTIQNGKLDGLARSRAFPNGTITTAKN